MKGVDFIEHNVIILQIVEKINKDRSINIC